MTRLEAMLTAYRAMGGPTEQTFPEASEYESLVRELTEVLAATSDRKGADVIRWWDCWDLGGAYNNATAWSRAFRTLVPKLEAIEL